MPQDPFYEEDGTDETLSADKAIEERGTTHAPSLLIGLGGTGAQVLLRVKRHLRERNVEDEAPLRFLFIDTDQNTFAPERGLPDIEDREKCLIGKDRVDNFVDDADNPDSFPALKSRFPKEHLQLSYIERLSQGVGASQIRSLGAFAVALQAGRVKSKLNKAYDDLTELTTRVQAKTGAKKIEIKDQVYIYLVGSLAGGTGSGGFLDVGMLSKHVCEQHDPKLVGMFALPEVFDDEVKEAEQKINIRANAYAALKELQFCLDSDRKERKEMGSISFEYDTPAIEQELSLDPHDPLFDLCYLIDDRNSKGRLSGADDLYSLIARSIFHDVGSSFGASTDSFNSNNAVFTKVSKCPKTNLGRLFGTISTSTLSYPAARVANYCTYRTAESVVRDHLIGNSPSETELRARLSDFLDQQDLEDRGEENQLLESLLRVESSRSLEPAPVDGEPLSQNRFALPSDYGEDLGMKKFAREIQKEWSEFSDETLPEIEDLVAQNQHHRIGEEDDSQQRLLRKVVEQLALSTAAEHGSRGAREILEMLEEVAEEMTTEFREESNEWEERKEWLAQKFTNSADELAQVGTIKAFFTSEDEDLKQHLITRSGEPVEGAILEKVRNSAHQVLDSLIAETKDIESRWGNFVTNLKRLRKTFGTDAKDLETHRDQRGIPLDQDITRPGHERRYYKNNGLSSEEAFNVVLGAYEEASDSRVGLFRDALQQMHQGPMGFANTLIAPLYDHIKAPIFDTNIVGLAKSNPEEIMEGRGGNALEEKLDIQTDLCQPFWPAETQEAEEFPDHKEIRAPEDHFDKEGNPVYPPEIDKWSDTHEFKCIPSSNKREIILSRKTYGARAFYLSGILDWKSKYEKRQKESREEYMTETHARLKKIPDLFPSENEKEPIRLFALGIALGFIIQRGDWYYYGIRREEDGVLDVIYKEQDWPSIHKQRDSTETANYIGDIDFSNRRGNFKDEHQLAQGRENSIEELRGSTERINLLREGINEYHESVGNERFKEELEYYIKFLEDKSFEKDSGTYDQEVNQIKNKISEIGE